MLLDFEEKSEDNAIRSPQTTNLTPEHIQKIQSGVIRICDLLKLMANENRLMILILLCGSERSVADLEKELFLSQPLVSQQLARLRAAKLVTTRRDRQSIYYSISSKDVRAVVLSLVRDFV